MKRFDDLTAGELLSLTDEQVQFHIDRECAEEGVPLLPPGPGAEPVKPIAPKDVTTYNVGGIAFAKREDAEKVAALVSASERMGTEYASYKDGDYSKVARPATDEVTVTTEAHFSREAYDRVRVALGSYADAKKRWDAGEKARTDAATGRARIAEHVTGKIDAARTEQYRSEQAKAEFARYVTLADGDTVLARRFFDKARPNDGKYLDA